ncbi:PREDICTED: transcription regulator protein BACH1-like [Poecilia mexicana]|uniref:BTB domain-containing protein n=1 Tax=Poecilia mexicana TaxID=48701 RepID=A0A3B3XJZ1_9TELE|nr:PREDICTED: transcription regulator protein BACH1-like [Poecilia mexicana]XP_014836166.1 PREDICTED: transcription regulator protein BACH1-like [Poecilia mexicana]
MSVMAGLTPRSSVFTFESTVHSSQVLHHLNEQRCRDMLCDVTVLVEGQSFGAHRSVLASCSEYFLQKISSPTQHGAVITLPEEVTVAGFEPLLQFAYTSKLNFGKDNVLEIRSSASILGFRDLDEACFDFLLPKFFLSRNGSAPIVRKTCCRKECKRRLSKENSATDSDDVLLDDKEVKPVADSSPKRDVTWDYNKSVSNKMGSQNSTRSLGAEGKNEPVIQGPKYRKFQLACEKGMFASEKCSFNSAVSEIRNGFALSCLSCPNKVHCEKQTAVDLTGNPNSNKCIESKAEVEEVWKTEKHNVKSENCESKVVVDISKEGTFEEGNQCCKVEEKNIRTHEEKMEYSSEVVSSEKTKIKTLSPKPSPILCERSSLPFCPLMCLGVDATITQSMGNEKCAVNNTESKTSRVSGAIISCSSQQNEMSEDKGKNQDDVSQQGRKSAQMSNMERAAIIRENSGERSTVKKETTDHLREQFRFSKDAYQQNFLDCEAGCSTDPCGNCVQSSSLLWSNLGSTKTGCPFYQDFDQMNCPMFESEGTTQSSVNSGEDGDSETETEGDSEFSTAERALQVQLPFSVDWIVNLNRNDFQQLLKQQVLTQEQLEFVHDIRRRSKNRLAAQRCRKRKLDCIYNLQCEINKLKTEREKLILEKSRLTQRKMETCHTVNALCRRVCSEANLHPDQLQVLASCTSSDCPLSSLVPQIDALLSQHGSSLHPKTSASQEDTLNPHTDTST